MLGKSRPVALLCVIVSHALVVVALIAPYFRKKEYERAEVGHSSEIHALLFTAAAWPIKGPPEISTERLSSDVLLNLDPEMPRIPAPEIAVEGEVIAFSSAPRLETSSPVEMERYAKEAGLRENETALVVLRLEILASGKTGCILVEVSSGREQVDAAAKALAAEQRWIAGTVDGKAQDAWIRWGVRLQGPADEF